MLRKCFISSLLLTLSTRLHGFVGRPSIIQRMNFGITVPDHNVKSIKSLRQLMHNDDNESNAPSRSSTSTIQSLIPSSISHTMVSAALVSTLVASSLVASPSTTYAYESNDYASETVQRAIQTLRDNYGNSEGIVRSYEDIAAIITEGKGVGGSINYQGIQLERGFVSDEDTTIYNPGLTLLTESEKDRLVEAIVQSKKAGVEVGQWNVDEQAGFDFLRERLDPLHMYELRGFLKFVPFYAAILYIVTLAVQQLARDLFPPAYIAGAVAFFVPIIILVSLGPQ